MPEDNVFDLTRGGKRSIKLYNEGITLIKDIPDGFKLSEKQKVQVDAALNGIQINKEGIWNTLEKLEYPLYFLDFETFSTPLPIFNGTKPWKQVVFQFSLHIQENENTELKHHSFLARGDKDPRENFLTTLKGVIGTKGSVIVYFEGFENSRLKELADLYPEHAKWIHEVMDRVVDIHKPFKQFYYYDPKQRGKTSIKNVLPALTDVSYKHLAIQNGQEAAIQFLKLVNGKKNEKIREALHKYCELDTKAMVDILEKLKQLMD